MIFKKLLFKFNRKTAILRSGTYENLILNVGPTVRIKTMKKLAPVLILFACIICTASQPIQLLPTSMRITVLNNLGNPVEGASIKVYTSQEAYDAGEPMVASGNSDQKGRFKVKDLEPTVYFIEAEKDELNNIGNGIVTDSLREGRMNKVNIIID